MESVGQEYRNIAMQASLFGFRFYMSHKAIFAVL